MIVLFPAKKLKSIDIIFYFYFLGCQLNDWVISSLEITQNQSIKVYYRIQWTYVRM